MDYQRPNAEVYGSAGAATLIDETDDNSGPLDDALVQQLKSLLIDEARRTRMAGNMRRMARPDAIANVCNVIYDTLFGTAFRLAA
jgi:UDP-N-acetylglucosamine:LPS N-acetylglucosamine transferase